MAQSRRRPMTDKELAAIIDEQVRDAVLWDGSAFGENGQALDTPSGFRAKALRYFEGEATLGGDVPPPPNRSSVVSRDLSDTHGWIMPSLLRSIAGGKNVVDYEPRRPDAEDGARQATDYINYLFMTECGGYMLLHAGFWDGLTFGNGVLKHWWDDTPEYRTESLSGIPEAKYIELVSDANVEVLAHTERPDDEDAGEATSSGGDQAEGDDEPNMIGAMNGGTLPLGQSPPAGAMMNGGGMMGGQLPPPQMNGAPSPLMPQPPLMLHDLKIKRKISNGRLRVVAIPQEEFRIDRHATALDEDHVRFCAHISRCTRSSLIQTGYPRAEVDELPEAATAGIDAAETWARDPRFGDADNAPDSSTELVEKWECYVKLDYNGDGVAEWRRVVTVSGASEREIFENEEWGEDLPFTDLVPDPMPHRWRGGSLFEEVADIQRIKTVFWRGINDNLYWVNNQQRWGLKGAVDQGSLDEMTSPTFGGTIWVTQPNAIGTLEVPFIADKLLAGLELADKIREFRTGVSAATMALDPQALQNQTATAVNDARTASHTKVETYARNICVGVERLFRCILKLVVKHQDQKRTIRLRGEWVDVDPRGWDADMDVVVNVGLGSGSRDRDLAILQPIAAKQEGIVASLGPVIATQLGMGPDTIFQTYRHMVEAAGLKSPESYFPEVKPETVQALMQQAAQQPDPAAAESAARVQLLNAQTQEVQARTAAGGMKAQGEMTKGQLDQQKAIFDLEHLKAQIENLRSAALVNMSKAGAVQSDAQINQALASLEALDRFVGWHQEQQRVHGDMVERMHRMVSTPGVN